MFYSTDPNDIKFARVNGDADGDNAVVAAVAGKKIRVLGYSLIGSAAGIVTVKSNATVLAELQVPAGLAPVPYAGGHDAPAFETAAGEALIFATQAAQDINGHLTYVEVAV